MLPLLALPCKIEMKNRLSVQKKQEACFILRYFPFSPVGYVLLILSIVRDKLSSSPSATSVYVDSCWCNSRIIEVTGPVSKQQTCLNCSNKIRRLINTCKLVFIRNNSEQELWFPVLGNIMIKNRKHTYLTEYPKQTTRCDHPADHRN